MCKLNRALAPPGSQPDAFHTLLHSTFSPDVIVRKCYLDLLVFFSMIHKQTPSEVRENRLNHRGIIPIILKQEFTVQCVALMMELSSGKRNTAGRDEQSKLYVVKSLCFYPCHFGLL